MSRVHQNKLVSVFGAVSSWCLHRGLYLTDSVEQTAATKKDHLKNCRGSITLTKPIDVSVTNAMLIVLTEPNLQSFQRLRLKTFVVAVCSIQYH